MLSLYAIASFLIIGLLLTLAILWFKAKFVTASECKLYINDDANLTREVSAGSTLLSALTGQGFPIPSPCGGKATCKQCRIRIVEGADEPLETDRATFPKKLLKEG